MSRQPVAWPIWLLYRSRAERRRTFAKWCRGRTRSEKRLWHKVASEIGKWAKGAKTEGQNPWFP